MIRRRLARSPQGMLREMVASMNSVQLALAAHAADLPTKALIAWAEGRTELASDAVQKLGGHLLSGRYFQKQEERARA